MNAPERLPLGDVQSLGDSRGLAIDAVGVKGLRYPVTIRSGSEAAPTIATFAMTVALDAATKGTHMSRFVELLEAQRGPLDLQGFASMAAEMLERLGAPAGEIEMRFAWFARKAAPVSGAASLVDYEVSWRAELGRDGCALRMRVVVPATSLCPCSKEISEYGAHNQRSAIAIEADLREALSIAELAGVAERSASCEVYGLLKRPDEKYVTERAYDNPRFVEDLVREAALALEADPRVRGYVVEAENFESIHNHSAFARIASRPRHGRP